MPTAIALIRGINVGGKNSLSMAELRELCESLGLEDVRTYIASGNVVFRAASRTIAKAPAALEAAIESRRGFKPTVVVRTADQWKALIDANPFANRRGIDKSRLLVMYLAAKPDAAASAVEKLSNGQEEAKLVGNEVFLHFPKGVAESKLTLAAVEKVVKVPGTCRNWNTVEKLQAMVEEAAG